MATFKIRHLTMRPGKDRCARYYWQPPKALRDAGWKLQRLPNDFDDAVREANRLNQELDDWRAGKIAAASNAKSGSVEALINSYKNHRRYKELKAKTRSGYDYVFRILYKLMGDMPVVAVQPSTVQKIYEKLRVDYPAKAVAVVRVLRLLMEHARREDMIKINPAERPGIRNQAAKGKLWMPDDVAHIVATADEMGNFEIGTAVFVNQWIGQRRGDIITLGPDAYRDGALHIKQSKTGAEVVLPIDMIPTVKARLEEQIARNAKIKPAPTVLIPAPNGQPFKEDWFTHLFGKIRDRAIETRPDMQHLVFKDLRHTAVTRLAEAGCPTPLIASVTGHSYRTCEEIVDRYNIRTTKMAQEAFQRRKNAENTNQPTTEGK